MNSVTLFYVGVKEQLEAIGFTAHSRPVIGSYGSQRIWWYCWCGPDNKWDCEVGEDCKSEDLAWEQALACSIAYMIDCHNKVESITDE